MEFTATVRWQGYHGGTRRETGGELDSGLEIFLHDAGKVTIFAGSVANLLPCSALDLLMRDNAPVFSAQVIAAGTSWSNNEAWVRLRIL